MLLKLRASPDMLPFSLCNKKRLAIRHTNTPLFPKTLSIPSYDIGKYFGLRTYQQPLVPNSKFRKRRHVTSCFSCNPECVCAIHTIWTNRDVPSIPTAQRQQVYYTHTVVVCRHATCTVREKIYGSFLWLSQALNTSSMSQTKQILSVFNFFPDLEHVFQFWADCWHWWHK